MSSRMLRWVFFNDIDCAESDEQWIFPVLVLVFYIQSNNKEESVFFSFMYIEIPNKKKTTVEQQLSNKTVLFL